jgi:hypothetical protein
MGDPDPATEERLERRQRALCPKCLAPNPPGVDFCGSCGAPVSFGAWIAPTHGKVADGWGLGESTHLERPSLVVVAFVWLMALPGLAILVVFAKDTDSAGGPWGVALYAAFALLYLWVAVRVTANRLRARRSATPPGEDGPPDASGDQRRA